MAHHNSTPQTVLDAPTLKPVLIHEHPQTAIKGVVIRTGPWTPYVAPADRQKRRGKKAARHAARTAQRAAA